MEEHIVKKENLASKEFKLMKKLIVTIMIVLAFATYSIAQDNKSRKAEFSLTVGGAFPQLDSSSSYFYGWRYLLTTDVQERGVIAASAENSLFFSGSFSYFFMKNVGLQAIFGYTKADVAKDASFAFSWAGRGRNVARNAAFEGSGDLKVIPISINGIAKFSFNEEKMGIYFSGGYTFFNNKFNATSFMGAGSAFRYQGYGQCDPQCFDAFRVPLDIDQSWNKSGANVGAGFDFKVSEMIGITADARYYYCPSEKFDWNWRSGTYQGYFYGLDDLVIDAETAQLLQQSITKLEVNPSFFKVSVGIKFFFDL